MSVLIESLALEKLTDNLFQGTTPPGDNMRIFGGQVVAQSLLAAYETVDRGLCHSLHAYFIYPGNPLLPIRFEVARLRDGGSFMTRTVNAVQEDKVILTCSLSFHVEVEGMEHHIAGGEGVVHADALEHDDPRGYTLGIELRTCRPPKPGLVADTHPPRHRLWCRSWHPIGPDPRHHQAVMAYMSDFPFLSTIVQPHPVTWRTPGMQVASLDHAIWFHRPFDINQWHLCDLDSPSAHGERGFARGTFYNEAGVPVVSATQEGLLRYRP